MSSPIPRKCKSCGDAFFMQCKCGKQDDQAQKPCPECGGSCVDLDKSQATMRREFVVDKPDASPREWTIQVDKRGRVLNSSGVRMDAENVHVIEKSAYDSLARKVEGLEAQTYISDSHMETIRENQDILKELAKAKAEIERLRQALSGAAE